MKTSTLVIIFSTILFLQSCGDKKQSPTASYKNKIVLGKFSDDVSLPTFDESKLTDLPRVVDLKAEISAVKDQSSRGTCTFFSTIGLVEASIKKDLQMEVNLSEEYLNFKTKTLGAHSRDEGSDVRSNLRAIEIGGVMLERDWSYQPSWFGPNLPCSKYKSTDRNAPLECFSHNSPDKETLAKTFNGEAFTFSVLSKDTNEIIRFLATHKQPLTMSVAVNFNGWPNTGDVYHNEELRQECLSNPTECGGHSILITGYDLDKKVFFFKNSWGHNWGHEGFGTITIETVDKFVTDALYSATTDKALEFPKDHAQENLEFLDFKLVRTDNDGSNLKISTSGSVRGLHGRTIYVSSFLSSKSKSIAEEASDSNTQSIRLSPNDGVADESYARAFKYFLPSEAVSLEWTAEAPLDLSFPANILATPTISGVLASESLDTLVRTTIYVHTDDSAFKVLKRIYHPIK